MATKHGYRWYGFYVRPRHEKTVCSQFEAKQQEAFLPLYRTRSRWADRWKTLSLPLFPGYVFCGFDPVSRSSVLSTSGAIDVVRLGYKPAPVETAEFEAVRLIVNSAAALEPYPHLVRGNPVVMRGGPFNGLTGTLIEIRNSLRLVVCVELLCRSVLVKIDRDWATPLPLSKSAKPCGASKLFIEIRLGKYVGGDFRNSLTRHNA